MNATQENAHSVDSTILYVASTGKNASEKIYRVVATVENFFEIIYNVHVELGGRNGRHAGQKRTYRIVNRARIFLFQKLIYLFTDFRNLCFLTERSCYQVSFDLSRMFQKLETKFPLFRNGIELSCSCSNSPQSTRN